MTSEDFDKAQLTKLATVLKQDEALTPETIDHLAEFIATYVQGLERARVGFIGAKMWASTSQTFTAHAPAYDVATLDTIDYSYGIGANTTAHTFTILTPGIYLVSFEVAFTGTTATDALAVEVRSGSTLLAYLDGRAAGTNATLAGTSVVKFLGNEVINLGATAPSRSSNAGINTVFLSLTKLN